MTGSFTWRRPGVPVYPCEHCQKIMTTMMMMMTTRPASWLIVYSVETLAERTKESSFWNPSSRLGRFRSFKKDDISDGLGSSKILLPLLHSFLPCLIKNDSISQ